MNEPTRLYKLRHSAAHFLAAAALELFPGTKLGTGPVTDNGFYYDLLLPQPITDADLPKLEKLMRSLMAKYVDFVQQPLTKTAALELFKDQPFKQELIEKFTQAGESLTTYESGAFVDLCEGGHVQNSKELNLKAFKLTTLAGAYWQANEANPQMTRVYGILFETPEQLQAYVTQLEEAKKRDHRKLGKELELFTIIDEIGPGLPLFYPKGALLRRLVENYIIDEQEQRGYVPIWIPHITKGKLYEISGHLDKYDAMYSPMKIDDDHYYLKPMNCPHFMMLYKTLPHSYRQLPLRYTCTTTNYRYEKSGELSGLTRVRALTQDDCHVFCRTDQIESEISLMLEMLGVVYAAFNLTDFWVRVSLRDSANTENYLGSDTVWNTAETALKTVVEHTGWKHEAVEGEAAFYGPKLDFMAKDAIGREWQLSTIQLDFNLPERFELEYTDSTGEKARPVVIHRAILGSTERFLGVMIEHFAGNFPVWLAPVQVQLLAVSEKHAQYCETLAQEFRRAKIRVEVDAENETIGKKIRNATKQKIPYILVVGDKEIEAGNLAIRKRGERETIMMSTEDFIEYVQEKISTKALEL